MASTCLMTNFLNRIGYTQLQSINDSTRVFETIEVFAPDLILLDLSMPGLSGFEILNALRADRQNEQHQANDATHRVYRIKLHERPADAKPLHDQKRLDSIE